MLSLAVSLTGFLISEKYSRRKRYLSSLFNFSSQCFSAMRYKNEGVFEIFKEFGKKELVFLNKVTPDNITDISSLQRLLLKEGILERDVFIISEFITRFGAGDIRAEENTCKFYSEKFKVLSKEAETELHDKGKLFKSLFMFVGAALFIMLI
jgi:stage III sporulation protein AB